MFGTVWYGLVRHCANETRDCIGLARWYVPTINIKEYYYYYIINVPIYIHVPKRTKRTKVPETRYCIGFGWHGRAYQRRTKRAKILTTLQFTVKSPCRFSE
jgi:hypothetical protein